MAKSLSRLANYDKNEDLQAEDVFTDADGKTVKAQLSKTGSKTQQSKGANLGTITGVSFQNWCFF